MEATNLKGNLPFRCTTTGPLTLHLARASALENAGICLHPLYGFAYLPGSGLKGMARAYSETVWLPAQPNQKQAWRQIEDVFGWAPNPDRKEQIKDPKHPAELRRENDIDPESPEIKASSGSIIFHDAWPESWPQLIVDIVNNHHPEYYQHDDNNHPPGDWENPVPVYFLAVNPGATFIFPLAKRRADVANELLDLARQWLLGALCHLGAGAKTNAGYGAFQHAGDVPPATVSAVAETWKQTTESSKHRAECLTTLELVTPAFLAGANQQADDCDLRPATLRGLLRWWWRTMHAGFVDVKTLRALEAAIWGDTKSGGAVRIVIEKVNGQGPQPYDKRSKANFNDQQKRSGHGIPNEDPWKTTQGLWYASYGMDETNRRRYYLEPGARWRLRLVARPTRFFVNRKDADDPKKAKQGKEINAEQALNQAKAALWLLCHFGGVGSKVRKGFGSLAADGFGEWKQELCQETATQLRQALQLSNNFDDNRAHSPSLQQMLGPVEVSFSWPNVWSVLDQVGFAYESAAHQRAHNAGKLALGLPRQIHRPRNQPLPHQNSATHQPPQRLRGPKGDRHSSPVHIHVEGKSGNWTVRVIAFPAAHLPDLATSRKFLEGFLKDFGDDLRRRAKLQSPPSGPGQGTSARQQTSPPSSGPTLPKPGDRVEAVLLEEKTKKGGWKAKHQATGISGPVQNSNDVPGDKKAGDTVTLIVASANEKEIAFRYPTAADEQKPKQPGGKRPPRGGRR
jgi:CRISPR-associated protein Cmr6